MYERHVAGIPFPESAPRLSSDGAPMIEPTASIADSTGGFCIDEKLQTFE
jgi:hypothetical protein